MNVLPKMRKIIPSLKRGGVLVAAFLTLTAFSVENTDTSGGSYSQPSEERAAQDLLPTSHDIMWDKLTKCKVDIHEDPKEDIYEYVISFTPEVKAMEGKELTISGFMLPLEATEKFKHFILSKRTPTCAFCPPGGPSEIVEVWTNEPVTWSEDMVSVTGKFSFTNDQKIGMFFKLSDAKLFAPQPPQRKNQ